jgi:hypothetical protein
MVYVDSDLIIRGMSLGAAKQIHEELGQAIEYLEVDKGK